MAIAKIAINEQMELLGKILTTYGSSELTLWKIPQAPSLPSNALKLININLTKTQSLSV